MTKISPNPCKAVNGDDLSEVLYPTVSQRVWIDGTTNRSTTPLTHYVADLIPTKDCLFAIGDVTVEATTLDHFIKSGTRKTVHTKEDAYIAVKNANSGETGYLYISEMV